VQEDVGDDDERHDEPRERDGAEESLGYNVAITSERTRPSKIVVLELDLFLVAIRFSIIVRRFRAHSCKDTFDPTAIVFAELKVILVNLLN
jgi:hypothetical protein